MTISSRTPEGAPNLCFVCGAEIRIDPSRPPGDAPCPNCGHLLWFSVASVTGLDPEVQIVRLPNIGIIDGPGIQSLGKELGDLLNDTSNKRILLNFQNVSFMSSAMIGKLISFGKNCKNADIDLRLCNINDNVEAVFKLLKLDRVFKIDKDEEKAIKAFDEKGWFD